MCVPFGLSLVTSALGAEISFEIVVGYSRRFTSDLEETERPTKQIPLEAKVLCRPDAHRERHNLDICTHKGQANKTTWEAPARAQTIFRY